MVFHWSLCESNSPQVSRTLLSILADLNIAVVWMVSSRPLFSKSNPLVAVLSAQITIGITITFQFSSKVEELNLLFAFFQFFPVVSWNGKFHCSAGSIFSVDYHLIWSSRQDLVIRLYLKIPKNYGLFIFSDGFWDEHIPFVRIVKFKHLAQFPVDHL